MFDIISTKKLLCDQYLCQRLEVTIAILVRCETSVSSPRLFDTSRTTHQRMLNLQSTVPHGCIVLDTFQPTVYDFPLSSSLAPETPYFLGISPKIPRLYGCTWVSSLHCDSAGWSVADERLVSNSCQLSN